MAEILNETARVFDDDALTFTARRGPFARLLLANTLLTALTLGIYRFWGKTRVRQYLWHNIQVLGDPLEYTGTGKELFLGFLIVVAILFPLGLVYGAIDTLVPPGETVLRVGLEILYYATIFALIQIGFYRMWRYRLSRTVWRGIRFGLDGSSWTFLKLATGWTLLCVITLGIAYPWMKVDLWRYQIAHTRLGSERFAFHGRGRQLLVPWLFVNIPLAMFVGMLVASVIFASEMAGADTGNRMAEFQGLIVRNTAALAWLGTIGGIGLLLLPFAYFNYRIRQTRFLLSGVALGETRVRCALPFGRLFGFAVLCGIVSLIALAPLFTLFTVGHGHPGGEAFLLMLGLFFMAVLVLPVIWAVVFVFEVLKQTVRTTSIENASFIETVAQGKQPDIKTGEGLADAFDIGAF